jgi:hypothetical protein
MRCRILPLLLAALCLAQPAAASAQAAPRSLLERVPVSLHVKVPLQRPALSTSGVLSQVGMGMLGGFAVSTAVMLPIAMAGWDGSGPSDAVILGLAGPAFVGGTMAGIHWAGRRQGMRGNPWATAGGVLVGLTVAGAAMQPFISEDGEEVGGPGPLLVFLLPAAGGTVGYALTRGTR